MSELIKTYKVTSEHINEKQNVKTMLMMKKKKRGFFFFFF